MPITDDEFKEMQDPDSWSFDAAARTPARGQRARVTFAVEFHRDELKLLQASATARGMTITEFIKRAALRASDEALRL